jgi:hypothetical protein
VGFSFVNRCYLGHERCPLAPGVDEKKNCYLKLGVNIVNRGRREPQFFFGDGWYIVSCIIEEGRLVAFTEKGLILMTWKVAREICIQQVGTWEIILAFAFKTGRGRKCISRWQVAGRSRNLSRRSCDRLFLHRFPDS